MHYSEKRLPRSSSIPAAVVSLILLSSLVILPRALYGQFRTRAFGEQFDMAVSQSIDREAGSLILVSAAIDHRHLVFFRKNGYFEARYRVYVDIESKGGIDPAGEVWEETITVDDYRETRSPNLRTVIRRSFPAGSGEYKVTMLIEVIGTSRKYKREEKVRLVGGEDGGIQLSTPIFYMPEASRASDRPESDELTFSLCSSPTSDGFLQIPGAVYVEFDSWLRISTGIILPGDEDDQGISLFCRILDARGRTIAYNRQELALDGQVTEFCFDLDADHLPIGFYNFSITAMHGPSGEKSTKEEPFVVLLNKGLFRENFPSLLTLLSVIADDDELSALREAAPGARREEWKRFWQLRDSSPEGGVNEGLSEFLRRVKFTLRTFSKRRPGWETDMGKIFIKHGNPDRITDRAGNQYAIGSAYQLWYYDSKGLVYIFANTMGGGEYRLIDTQMY